MEWTEDRIALRGSRCARCGETDFPPQAACRRCGATETHTVRLPDRGVLWSWTIQRFPPPSPPYVPRSGEFEPFGLGYVELPGEVIVEALLTDADPAALRIGMPLRLIPFEVLSHCGERAITFAFAPETEGDRQ
ncbi:DNA-binding protein [Nocardia yunnanensis]|uniref:DNA-binding protein n=2 Tax=Nocardia yunnanensis TaxID=2382165 RepID=A0A386ZC91_9NOCA|nr:DNA-binding protein [Nocardia yunnanensis]